MLPDLSRQAVTHAHKSVCKTVSFLYRLFTEHDGQCNFVDKAVQVDPLELQSMQPYPQLFTAAGGSGTYVTDSNSPTSPFERLGDEVSEVSDISSIIMCSRICAKCVLLSFACDGMAADLASLMSYPGDLPTTSVAWVFSTNKMGVPDILGLIEVVQGRLEISAFSTGVLA